jgi:hypothetical protein
MIENDANWNFRRFKSPEVCQFLIKMRILGGASGKKHPQTAWVSATHARTTPDKRSVPLFWKRCGA